MAINGAIDSYTAPVSAVPGSVVPVDIFFRNTGDEDGSFRTRIDYGSTSIWGLRGTMALGPGQLTADWHDIIMPSTDTVFNAHLLVWDPIGEGWWIADILSFTVTAEVAPLLPQAEIVGIQELPASAPPDTLIEVVVTVRNVGASVGNVQLRALLNTTPLTVDPEFVDLGVNGEQDFSFSFSMPSSNVVLILNAYSWNGTEWVPDDSEALNILVDEALPPPSYTNLTPTVFAGKATFG